MSASRPSLDDLIRAQRSTVGLTEAQRVASRDQVLAKATTAGAALTASAVAKASVAATSGWQVYGALVVVLACGAGAALFSGLRPAGVDAKVMESSPIRLATRLAADSAVPMPTSAPIAASASASSAEARRPSPSRPASAGASSSLASELALMREVNAALKAGQPARALELLKTPRNGDGGYMREEREAARVFALCQSGNGRAARAEAEVFVRRHPQSPLASRVRATCSSTGATVPKNKD